MMFKPVFCAWGVLAAVLGGVVTNASAATVTLKPTTQNNPNGQGIIGFYQYGMAFTNTGYLTASHSQIQDISFDSYGLLELSLGSIPSGATIQSAELRFTMTNGNLPSNSKIRVYGYSGSEGADGQFTASDNSNVSGSTYWTTDSTIPLAAPNNIPVTFDVTSFIQSLVSGQSGYAGFLFRDMGTGFNQNGEYIDSSYSTSDDYWMTSPGGPRLVITYTAAPIPEPASLAIVGLPTAALLLRRKR